MTGRSGAGESKKEMPTPFEWDKAVTKKKITINSK